jgi:cytochrome c oxidase subunit 3
MIHRHPYHLVQLSPWPLTGTMGATLLMFSLTFWFHSNYPIIIPIRALIILVTIISWWRDILREASYEGKHTYKVRQGIEWGIILFILSEIIFFLAFFWAFFHRSLSPTHELGCIWPPEGVSPLNPYAVPLLNTAVLLTSGVTVTWAHHSLVINDNHSLQLGLLLTVTLGVYFTYLQSTEYFDTSFNLADRVYGSTFFVATGFHGAHVIIGSLFLLTCLCRSILNQITISAHFGLEAAAWYWHFVDVVWIFLYMCIYWWGGP